MRPDVSALVKRDLPIGPVLDDHGGGVAIGPFVGAVAGESEDALFQPAYQMDGSAGECVHGYRNL
jgi:hypothetical protein